MDRDMPEPLLDVRDLAIGFPAPGGTVEAVAGASFAIESGRTLCLVGESGCGKSTTARALLQIVDPPGRITRGTIAYSGDHASVDIARLKPKSAAMRTLRWREIAMIFQEPMSSMSPVHTIGNQITEAILLHTPGLGAAAARLQAIELLGRVGIPDPERRVDAYPFTLSGGLRQRAMIAMALACKPKLLIADEPTTALDVTTQAVILDLLRELKRANGMAMLFITHDLGVVAEIADDVAVMYLGHIVEKGPVADVLGAPRHPYTRALLASRPMIGARRGGGKSPLASIRGMVPSLANRPLGCPFQTRCAQAIPGLCDRIMPETRIEGARELRCHLEQKVAA
jgi:oligopeptide/dipeptide ABC transporter ATP-binding protein